MAKGEEQSTSPYATAADLVKYVMKLREQALLKVQPPARTAIQRFPWKTNIVTTVFWVGEEAGPKNPSSYQKGGNKGKNGKVSSHGHLSFDNYEQDQVMVIKGNQDEEGKSSFIRIMDQPDYSLEPLMQLMEKNRDLPKEQQQAAQENFLKNRPRPQSRLFLGRKADRSAALVLKDPEGRTESCSKSAPMAHRACSFFDASGKVLNEIPEKGQ